MVAHCWILPELGEPGRALSGLETVQSTTMVGHEVEVEFEILVHHRKHRSVGKSLSDEANAICSHPSHDIEFRRRGGLRMLTPTRFLAKT